MPSVAYRFTDWFSAGLSVNLMYGVLKDEVAVNPVLPGHPMARSRSIRTHGAWARSSASCSSQPRARASARPTTSASRSTSARHPALTNVAGPLLALQKPLTLGMKVPQGVMASLYQELTPAFALLGERRVAELGAVREARGPARRRGTDLDHHQHSLLRHLARRSRGADQGGEGMAALDGRVLRLEHGRGQGPKPVLASGSGLAVRGWRSAPRVRIRRTGLRLRVPVGRRPCRWTSTAARCPAGSRAATTAPSSTSLG